MVDWPAYIVSQIREEAVEDDEGWQYLCFAIGVCFFAFALVMGIMNECFQARVNNPIFIDKEGDHTKYKGSFVVFTGSPAFKVNLTDEDMKKQENSMPSV